MQNAISVKILRNMQKQLIKLHLIPNQYTKCQGPSSNTLRNILLIRFQSDFWKGVLKTLELRSFQRKQKIQISYFSTRNSYIKFQDHSMHSSKVTRGINENCSSTDTMFGHVLGMDELGERRSGVGQKGSYMDVQSKPLTGQPYFPSDHNRLPCTSESLAIWNCLECKWINVCMYQCLRVRLLQSIMPGTLKQLQLFLPF